MKLCVVGTGADRDPDDPHHFIGNAGNALYLFEVDDEGTLSQVLFFCSFFLHHILFPIFFLRLPLPPSLPPTRRTPLRRMY